jgi:3-hydroxybutyryl-CoA dehydrogenase
MTGMDREILGVVGAGIMGAGIAQVGLAAGYRVVLHDARADSLPRARDEILKRLGRLVEKGQLAPALLETAPDRLVLAADLQELRPAGLVIEAIFEDLAAKRAVFAALEAVVADETVLATNTSSLSIAAIGKECRRRDRVCGMHFFNPVPLMRLVEIVGTPSTSAQAIEVATAAATRFGKTAVKVADAPGFLVNLCGRAYTTEALHIVQEGAADFRQVDRIMRDGWGFRMGPFELLDLTGIDVNFPVTNYIWHGHQDDPRLKTTLLHESLFDAGRFGRKSGGGFYEYGDAEAPPEPAPEPAPIPRNLRAWVPEAAPDDLAGLDRLGADDGLSPILVFPEGEDATGAACRLDLDAARAVAIDLTCRDRKLITIMKPPGAARAAVEAVAAWLGSQGFAVVEIRDSPGFVAPRILAMVANLGCDVAQIGLAAPADIDLAMRLGLNYPQGPLELAALLGPARLWRILLQLQAITGSDRYRPSLWLRRRAMLNLPIHEPD